MASETLLLTRFGSGLRSLNTRQISAEEYAHCYREWGGSFIVHPEVLNYFEATHNVKVRYRGYFKNGQCVGAVPVWGAFVAGDHSALHAHQLDRKEDFGYPVIHLPIDPQSKCHVLYKAKYLLSLQQPQIAGALFMKRKQMAILKQLPDELEAGKKEYQIKERRFKRQGGIARDIQAFSGEEIAAIYVDLFQQRWDRPPQGAAMLGHTFSALKKFLFGKILWLDDHPIAIQINYRADTRRTICIDYVNGGVVKTLKNLSPGSLLSYINGCNACEESRQTGKQLIYSYGKANTEYKDQWCHRVTRGLTGYWLP
ncbi:GNAT family N-acetyltransferase [Dyella choica]|uniref:GNAT family N-acetyltransferase n=1 Tax=Dyella choica TaxID=1927959 RepID=A0A432M6Z9_9GAMM|nr:GNAT family N-acetyltransferase [Dyella choica]RUL76102.1 GNAT family N-acetyltransferase [Dyella choica]